ncbi:MAG: hypothetical protein KIT58_24000, partial [Planctomycetota bacterium]|nr:hypothetical protein [Planctomycetota bacterium]
MSDQNQILRLLATIREECAGIRSRQEELYEILISYKDQIQDLKQTVTEKLAGLPRSPYIAGQLVPAPHKVDGVDDYRELLATYLHKVTDSTPADDERPVDLVWEKPAAVRPEDIPLEDDEDERPRRHHGGGGGGGGGSPGNGTGGGPSCTAPIGGCGQGVYDSNACTCACFYRYCQNPTTRTCSYSADYSHATMTWTCPTPTNATQANQACGNGWICDIDLQGGGSDPGGSG